MMDNWISFAPIRILRPNHLLAIAFRKHPLGWSSNVPWGSRDTNKMEIFKFEWSLANLHFLRGNKPGQKKGWGGGNCGYICFTSVFQLHIFSCMSSFREVGKRQQRDPFGFRKIICNEHHHHSSSSSSSSLYAKQCIAIQVGWICCVHGSSERSLLLVVHSFCCR